MRQSLELKLGQRLTMTPQLQQAIRLLQLSALELQAEIQEALESNLMLEEIEEGSGDYEVNGATREESPAADAAEPDRSESDIDLDTVSPTELPPDTDWDDPYELPIAPNARQTSGEQPFELEARTSSPQTLRDHLEWQMRMTPLSDTDREIAQAIIDSISEDGYLTSDLEDIQQSLDPELEVDIDEIEAVLHHIQTFEPLGVGARDLGECLLLQLKALDPSTPALAHARDLVSKHLALLAARDFNQLKRVLKLKPEELQEAVQLIQGLNPRPGSAIQSAQTTYITPDVIVRKHKGNWRVELNSEAFPRLGVNHRYESLIRRGGTSRDNKFLQDQLQEARWFIKSLHNRNETLLRVATSIVDRQRDFFEYGEQAMKPLVLHDIAETLGLHESTISRVTTQKYMLTPRGIYELKYFFSSHVNTSDGGTASATAIRSLIKKIIESEPSSKPVSDSKIVELLEDQGIQVARRTVAKYREHMNIPPSSQRKSLV
jgi:RNA polymerase sigma-54 factor